MTRGIYYIVTPKIRDMENITDNQKAQEISDSYYMPDTGFNREDLYDAGMEMAQWKEEQMIEKACEWLKDNANDYLDWYDWESCRVNIDELLYDFRKAMKGE